MPIAPEKDATPFATVSMDFITELPLSRGFDAIAVFVDHDVTKAAVIAPCHSTITADQTALLYQNHVWRRFGLPRKLISDRGTQFTAHFFKELCRLLGITQAMSTAYHPQTDGQTERLNQELEQYLRAFCTMRQDDWADHLVSAEFAHNIKAHSTIDVSPFEALMGYNPSSLPSVIPPTPVPAVADRLQHLVHLRDEIQAAQRVAHRCWSDDHASPPYKVDDLVYLEGKHISTFYPTKKLAPRRHGPFKIIKVVNPVTFRLELPPSWLARNIFPVFHGSFLSPYVTTPAYGPHFPRPTPDIIDNSEHFEVDSVINSRFHRHRLQYLVHWKGYPSSDDLWLPASELSSAPDAVAAFHLLHPDAPRSLRSELITRRRGRRP